MQQTPPTQRGTPHRAPTASAHTRTGTPQRNRITVTHPHESDGPPQCRHSAAQQMRIRLARRRLQEARAADMGMEQAATLIFTVDRLANALEDALNMLEEDCTGGPSDL